MSTAIPPLLHWYHCKSCKMTLVTIVKAVYGKPHRCIACRSYMTFQWSERARNRRQLTWARIGRVYNPSNSCATCGEIPNRLTQIVLGDDVFCSEACAQPELDRREAALSGATQGE